MSVLMVVLPLAVILSGLAAMAFIWATRRGQFDDLDTPAVRLLSDDLREHLRGRTSKSEVQISNIDEPVRNHLG